MNRVTRREFCGLALAGAISPAGLAAEPNEIQMLTRAIPVSGERIAVIGMGTSGTFDVGESTADRAALRQVLEAFYAAGASVIDTSPMYGRAERVTGDLIAELGARNRTFVATKVWTNGRERGLEQIRESMRLLRTDVLDLLQIHNLVDWHTHVRSLRELKERGRIRYTGITHYTVASHEDLEAALRQQPFDFVQLNYSIATRSAEQRLLPFCQERGIAVLVNRAYEDGALFARVRGRPLPGWASDIDCASWGEIFLKYVVSHPAVTCVIPATSSVRHLEDNMGAGRGWVPDAAARERMAAALD